MNKEKMPLMIKSLLAILVSVAIYGVWVEHPEAVATTASRVMAFLGFEQRELLYPEADRFDPSSSRVHDSWGEVLFPSHSEVAGTSEYIANAERFGGRGFLPLSEWRRWPHPTVIWKLKNQPHYIVSIDGTNEGSEEDPYRNHTTRNRMPSVRPEASVIVRYRDGRISDATGKPAPFLRGACRESVEPYLYEGEAYRYQTADGCGWHAVLVRIRSENSVGKWHKFCYRDTACSGEILMINDLGEPAWLEFYNNAMFRGVDAGATGMELTLIHNRFGLNGDRLELEVGM